MFFILFSFAWGGENIAWGGGCWGFGRTTHVACTLLAATWSPLSIEYINERGWR